VATDSYPTVNVPTHAVELDLPKLYLYQTKSESDYQPGDRAFLVAQSAVTPQVGSRFTLASVQWKVEQVQPVADAWLLRARLA
jgi:hypothetical protein